MMSLTEAHCTTVILASYTLELQQNHNITDFMKLAMTPNMH
jgi:hypothetical protein